ncbi:hypothetical protein AcV5_004606 [Taiwanofungus camphoratus]|nr:hypothetical protein AcW2_000792 [Antrodia cinnamomea]KAI0936475.1 hypothetical protein AcV5_004606 [Antrodia cinnamomea]KAI0961690.1 hypothetical protein AcV7_000727 [Antrodia cinnamomea]
MIHRPALGGIERIFQQPVHHGSEPLYDLKHPITTTNIFSNLFYIQQLGNQWPSSFPVLSVHAIANPIPVSNTPISSDQTALNIIRLDTLVRVCVTDELFLLEALHASKGEQSCQWMKGLLS